MNHLKIIQGNLQPDTEEVDMTIINKLYELASSGDLDAASELKGYLHLQVGDRAKIEYLTNMFQNKLFITASNYLIPFEDQNMVTYLNSIGVGSNGTITEDDAAAATIVANSANTTVTKFNELQYFTQITQSRGGLNGNNSGWVRFKDWTSLEEIDISNFTSVGHISPSGWEDTFSGCTSLKKVTASNKLEVLGYRAFYGCTNLEEITNLSGTITARYGAFYNCQKLKPECFANCEIFIPAPQPQQDSDWQFYNTKALTSITLSPQCFMIPKACFKESGLTSITIPSGVTSIGEQAFNLCSDLTTVNLSNSVSTIGPDAFNGCTSLSTIDLSHVTFIDRLAFGSTVLTSVDLSSVTSFGGRGVFEKCSQLTTVVLSNSITTLPEEMFTECSSLTTVNIPSGMTIIPKRCFRGCSSLTSINLPNSVTTLEEGSFYGCSQMTSINLSNITSFGNSCLDTCTLLTASDVNWTNVTKIEGAAFAKVHIQQQNLVIPNLTDIGSWPFGNNNSSGITSVDFTGSTFTWLNAGLFEGHSSIDHVTLPATLSTIGGWGHFSNTSARWIKFLSTSIIAFESGRDAGHLGIPTSTKIYVLDALVNDWKADSKWSSIASQIFPMSQFSTDFPNG